MNQPQQDNAQSFHANGLVYGSDFASRVLAWYDRHGRKNLPWQQQVNPYRVWISEIMLQQTQVATVIPYYQHFMQSFPTLSDLAQASQDTVLKHWEGLGYYSRARHLHRSAQIVAEQYQGELPLIRTQLESLPGIGRSTAGAILSLAADQREAILDGNVKRVLARYHAVEGYPGQSAVLKRLWTYAEQHLPKQRYAAYTQAMMDLGATLCTRRKPACLLCPLQQDCQARLQGNPLAYPHPKPKKILPEKSRFALVLRKPDGSIALQKRPPTGVWGGLWSLPELTEQAEVLQLLQASKPTQKWVVSPDIHSDKIPDTNVSLTHLPALQHQFSHYRLILTPLLVDVPETFHVKPAGVMDVDDWLWYKAGDLFDGGLSSAAKRLLKNLQEA